MPFQHVENEQQYKENLIYHNSSPAQDPFSASSQQETINLFSARSDSQHIPAAKASRVRGSSKFSLVFTSIEQF